MNIRFHVNVYTLAVFALALLGGSFLGLLSESVGVGLLVVIFILLANLLGQLEGQKEK